ncbi:MAG: hypothetical protein L3J15_07955 [Devosiaceae bacterium]|nr:hypothetical protein [Devosiaceae bacterium]
MKNYLKIVLSALVVFAGLGFGGAYAQIFNLQTNFNAPKNSAPALLLLTELIAQQNCYSNQQIQQAVQNKQILPLNVVLRNGGVSKTSKVLPPISVCDVNGVLFYKFSILDKNGKATKLTLPATAPLS